MPPHEKLHIGLYTVPIYIHIYIYINNSCICIAVKVEPMESGDNFDLYLLEVLCVLH